MSKEFFPPRPESRPTIYAYKDMNPQYEGLLKIGYTTVNAQSRVAQQDPTLRPGKPPYRIVLEESAMRGDGSGFGDFSDNALETYRQRAKIADVVGSDAFNRRLLRQGLLMEECGVLVPTGFGFLLFGKEPRTDMRQAGLLGLILYPSAMQTRTGSDQANLLL